MDFKVKLLKGRKHILMHYPRLSVQPRVSPAKNEYYPEPWEFFIDDKPTGSLLHNLKSSRELRGAGDKLKWAYDNKDGKAKEYMDELRQAFGGHFEKIFSGKTYSNKEIQQIIREEMDRIGQEHDENLHYEKFLPQKERARRNALYDSWEKEPGRTNIIVSELIDQGLSDLEIVLLFLEG